MKIIKNKGFTFIELIITIAIFSIAVAGISSALITGIKATARNSNKVDTSLYAQYMIQTYKGQGKNYLKSLYSGSNSFQGYCYFNNTTELNRVLDGSENLINGTYQKMIQESGSNQKNFGAHVTLSTVRLLGTKINSTQEVNLNSEFDNVKIQIKIVNFRERGKDDSELIFYLGR